MNQGRRFCDEPFPDDYYHDEEYEEELKLAAASSEYMEEPDYRDIIRQLTLSSLQNG
jgi:hypothetical protein